MYIREMGMIVRHWLMHVRMTVFYTRFDRKLVCMLMMFIMDVGVRMFQHIVHMLVLVIFCEMPPNTQGHQSSGNE